MSLTPDKILNSLVYTVERYCMSTHTVVSNFLKNSPVFWPTLYIFIFIHHLVVALRWVPFSEFGGRGLGTEKKEGERISVKPKSADDYVERPNEYLKILR